MGVTIDHDRGQGHGRCVSTAPDLFYGDGLGSGAVLNGGVAPEGAAARARPAVASCPKGAVSGEGA